MSRLIQTTIMCGDLDKSIEFYRDGIGLVLLAEDEAVSPYAQLLGSTDGLVQVAQLADPNSVEVNILELSRWVNASPTQRLSGLPRGPFMIGFQCDYDDVMGRLRSKGYHEIGERIVDIPASSVSEGGTGKVGFVEDPDGTVVLLLSENFPTPSAQLRPASVMEWPSSAPPPPQTA
jgi:catechol 2,3-dioxygenase-like lactoylglutathione lyase family enzyme